MSSRCDPFTDCEIASKVSTERSSMPTSNTLSEREFKSMMHVIRVVDITLEMLYPEAMRQHQLGTKRSQNAKDLPNGALSVHSR